MTAPNYVACRECDLLHRRAPLPDDGVARCRRCDAVLYTHRHDRSDQTVAWAITGLILFSIANIVPIVSIEVQGGGGQATLLSSVVDLYAQRRPVVAGVVLFTGIIAPLMQLVGTLYVVLPTKWGFAPVHLSRVLRLMEIARPWNMVSIFLLSVLVSLTKLGAMAHVTVGMGLWAMVGLIVALAVTEATFDPEPLWARVEPVGA